MNRFTDLSKSVRQEIAAQRLAAESEADREKRLAAEKRQAQVRLLSDQVIPMLEEARDGLAADSVDAEVRVGDGIEPAAVLIIDGGVEQVDDSTFRVGETHELVVTTAGGAFVIQVKGGSKGATDAVATEADLEEVLLKAFRNLLLQYHGEANQPR